MIGIVGPAYADYDEPVILARNDAAIEADRYTRAILPNVSRTFAVGVRLLPPRIELPVRLGYLLCRIADTIEDDLALGAPRKAELLDAFAACFDDSECADNFGRTALELTTSHDYRALVAASGEVFALYRLLDYPTRTILRRWILEMVDGMQTFVLAYPGGIRIANMLEFHQYCYYVAGTVGHLLTDLWRQHSRSINARVHARLLEDCESFGEALQVVNILKDIAWDAEHENAVFVPSNVLYAVGSGHDSILDGVRRVANRTALEPLIAIAKNDIERGLCYIENIPLHALRVRLFCALPILFAVATTREIERSEEMLVPGGGVKISRIEVRNIIIAARTSTLSNRSLRWLIDSLRRRPLGSSSVG
jgi:farnesyl-diphosphate farnesyltransferase